MFRQANSSLAVRDRALVHHRIRGVLCRERLVSNRAVQGSVAGSAGGALVPNNLTLHLSWQANAGKRLSRRV